MVLANPEECLLFRPKLALEPNLLPINHTNLRKPLKGIECHIIKVKKMTEAIPSQPHGIAFVRAELKVISNYGSIDMEKPRGR